MTTSKGKGNGNIRNNVKKIVSILLILLCIISSYLIWVDRAYNLTISNKEEIQIQNGERIISVNSNITIENYIPFTRTHVIPSLKEQLNNHSLGDRINNTISNFTAYQIAIDSITITQKYVSQDVYPPTTIKNATTIPTVDTDGMSEMTMSIDWRYNITQEQLDRKIIGIHFTMVDNQYKLNPIEKAELYVGLFSLFTVIGCLVSFLVFSEKNLRSAYGDLPKLKGKLDNDETFNKIHGSLKKIVTFPNPNQISAITKYFFGISVLIFNIAINNQCKKHSENLSSYTVAPYKKTQLKSTLEKYTKRTLSKIEDNMPELKTILVAITFFTTIGISFSWNVGAITAFITTLGFFYLFINIGSTFYLVSKSAEDIGWTIALFGLSVFVIVFPMLIQLSRILS